MTSVVSMGIYALEPEALEYIPASGYFDFPDLVQALLAAGEKVGAYRYNGLWFDIGRRDDYEEAVAAWSEASCEPAFTRSCSDRLGKDLTSRGGEQARPCRGSDAQ